MTGFIRPGRSAEAEEVCPVPFEAAVRYRSSFSLARKYIARHGGIREGA